MQAAGKGGPESFARFMFADTPCSWCAIGLTEVASSQLMTVDDVRRLALSLPEVVEEPHFQMASFCIRGKIFATVPPDNEYLHLFVAELERETMITLYPDAYEKLWWGEKVAGLRVRLTAANTADVGKLLRSAWQFKAPRKLVGLLPQDQYEQP